MLRGRAEEQKLAVDVVTTVALKSAGSVRVFGFVTVTTRDCASSASAAVLATALPPAVSWTDALLTLAGKTGSEKVTVMGSRRLTELLPRLGTTSVTLGGV